ncbi:MAG: multicopper oxidase domain-containing protein [Actinomycetia bacterium]|nr:multicopper oxidase domain-containing protein [Actinomycetes bacterium]
MAEQWRLINTCTSRVLSLRLEGHQLTQIAGDGHFLPAPGNRADFVVDPSAQGRFALWTDPYDRGILGILGMLGGGGSTTASGPVALATAAVSGSNRTTPPLPAALARPGVAIRARQRATHGALRNADGHGRRWHEMDHRRTRLQCLAHRSSRTARCDGRVDGDQYQLHGPPLPPSRLAVPGTRHQHAPGAEQSLHDVVLVPARGWARPRLHFADFAGRSVYHCHTLDHEDTEMMATIEVAPSKCRVMMPVWT